MGNRDRNTKRKPEYLLSTVKKLVTSNDVKISINAIRDIEGAGLTQMVIPEIILQLQPTDFHISSYYPDTPDKRWQDAYKTYFEGQSLYVKFKITSSGELLIITSSKPNSD
ncbi:type II toxin-antitoxin system MqsR family toxin [Halodesulfovibrio spirochaetisodalis]|uniref:Motility quorum-sensing regulator MqsR n=1 Tax=Halodesulfovibrio spirochaetisodalis TaxID=1560234 RepID=A0A1B7XA29_9BACT|nr:type II toxin-antitoxin system MqsR family toxin [Halodesulfovibrio spirochaetisodalis]OBQ46234.1 hypothetical protein SP90_13640 [Halodesulfovibrio spirochaetisodalis]